MKKIGIITFHRAINYGAVLQAYALQKHLLNLGYEVFEIDYVPRNEIDKYKSFSIKRIKTPRKFLADLKNLSKNICKNKKFNLFLKNNMILTSEKYNEKTLFENYHKFDVLITGSDQVWNYELLNGVDKAYFLNFGDSSLKRISYAASIGKNEIENEYISEFKSAISVLDYISVREKTAQELLEKMNISNVNVVCDPVFLLDKDTWSKVLPKPKNNGKYILSYMLSKSDEYCRMVEELAKKTKLKIIHFESRSHYECENESSYTSDPFEFVNLIKNAEYVITTSFHATAFSIIFEKDFYVYPYNKTASRVTDLLKKLGLSNRIINSLKEFKEVKHETISFEDANEILKKERSRSIEWLKNAIEKDK